jgi:endonuclease III
MRNHQAVAHARSTLEKIKLVHAGQQLTGRHKVFGAAYRLLNPALPAPTVTRSGFRDFVHPSRERLCTVRELARLQTFPDSHEFKGRRCDTYAKSRYLKQTQHEQVGNAVPPLLARVVAKQIRRQLIEHRDIDDLTTRQRLFDTAFPLLDAAYPQDFLGNQRNPLDELIYIMLSRRTRDQQYRVGYELLARRFRPWKKIFTASDRELRDVLRPLGLANQRAHLLRAVLLTIYSDFGRLTLTPLRRMGYSDAYNYLRSLPGVNDKTAKCVMLYSLNLPALPIDAHTFRVSRLIGLLPLDTSFHLAPAKLDAIVPPEKRGRYHVLTILHGRRVCTPARPRCDICPLRTRCCARSSERGTRSQIPD